MKAVFVALVVAWLSHEPVVAEENSAARDGAARFEVSAPPAEMKLPPFYKKYVSANGYPIVSSGKVNDYALKEAAYLANMMLAQRPDVR